MKILIFHFYEELIACKNLKLTNGILNIKEIMGIKKVYYGGKCIMTVDMDYVKEDSMYEYLNEILRMLQERAYKEFDGEKRM